MDKNETHRYLTRLYDIDDDFEVAYLKPDARPSRVVRNLTDPDGLLDEMERAEGAGFNVYASVLPTRLQDGVYDRIWADMDDVTAPYPWGVDAPHPLPEPTTLVKTSEEAEGFRWQAIWRLDDGALLGDTGRDVVKRLARAIGADQAVHDPRRVLRVPGIINAKRDQMARLVSTTEDRFSLKAFDLPEGGSGSDLLKTLQTAEVSNPAHVLGEWLDGAKEGDRNRKAYVVARFLKGCGVDYEDAGPILKMGALRADPPLPDHELIHAMNSAYHRA